MTNHPLKPLARAALLALAGSTALAQQEPAQLQRVEVTGSHIKRLESEVATPIQVIRREDIARTGATTLRELLDTISSSTATTLNDLNGGNAFSPGASGVALRNLGKQSTLLLLNFRRVAPYPLADYNEVFSNLDALPLDAVERVEILKNGGSALYGSDAVAGVINVITKPGFQGWQLGASGRQASKTGKFRESNAGLSAGFGDYERDGFNLLANVELYRRQALDSWRPLLKDVNPEYPAISPSFGSFSTFSYPGNVIGVGPVAGCATVINGLCRYDRYERFQVQPGAERSNLLLSARFKAGAEMEGFAELLQARTETRYKSAFSTYGLGSTTVWGDPRTGAPRVFIERGLPAGHPLNPTGEEVEFRYRFADGASEETVTTNQYRMLAGLRGVWSGLDWESALGVMGGKSDDRQRLSYSDRAFRELIGDYEAEVLAPDFFNKPGGYRIGQANSAEIIDRLFPRFGYEGDTRQVFWDGRLSGEIGRFMAGPVNLATGIELRRESYRISPTQNLAEGDIVGFGVVASDASRNTAALFGELSLQPLDSLELQVAARVDKFPGFAAHASPKLALRWQPSKTWLMRATAETGFRAPNLTESAPSTKFSFQSGVSDPKRCPAASRLATDLQAQADALPPDDPQVPLLLARADSVVNNECTVGMPNINRHNPGLKPETSRSLSAGLVFQPLPEISVSLDAWHIERKNEIGAKNINTLLAQEASLAPGVIVRSPVGVNDPSFSAAERTRYGVTAGALLAANGRFENLFRTKTSGVDLGVKASTATPIGRLSYGLDAVHVAKLQNWSEELGRYGDNLAGRYQVPDWVVSNQFTLVTGAFSNTLRHTWQSETTLNTDYFDSDWTVEGCTQFRVSSAQCRVKAYSRLDWHLAWTGWNKQLSLGLHVRNLLNERPPVDMRAFGGSTGIVPVSAEDVQGRVYRISASYKF